MNPSASSGDDSPTDGARSSSHRRVSREEVARRAGVSNATVSRVFNHPERVAPVKREAVLQAAADLDYVPNKSASSLRRQGSGQILFLELQRNEPDYWSTHRYYRWFLADAVQSAMEVVNGSMYQLGMDVWRVDEDPRELIRAHNPDGVICYDVETEREAERIHAMGIPYVLTWHVEHFSRFSRCSTDNFYGGELAGRYMRERGHDKAVYVTAPSFKPAVHESRLAGFMHGFESPCVSIIRTTSGKQGGYEATAEVLRLVEREGIHAVGVVNDIAAIGLANGLMLEGMRVPQDVSLIGYDNMPISAALPFTLASIELDIGRLYKVATEALLEGVRNGEPIDMSLRPQLVPGESVKEV